MTKLKINSTPSGAQVFIGDEPKGRTPLDIKLPSKKYAFRISLKDYDTWEATIQLVDKEEPLDVKLEPMGKKEP